MVRTARDHEGMLNLPVRMETAIMPTLLHLAPMQMGMLGLLLWHEKDARKTRYEDSVDDQFKHWSGKQSSSARARMSRRLTMSEGHTDCARLLHTLREDVYEVC